MYLYLSLLLIHTGFSAHLRRAHQGLPKDRLSVKSLANEVGPGLVTKKTVNDIIKAPINAQRGDIKAAECMLSEKSIIPPVIYDDGLSVDDSEDIEGEFAEIDEGSGDSDQMDENDCEDDDNKVTLHNLVRFGVYVHW